MPTRAVQNFETTQGNDWELRIPMFDAPDGISTATPMDFTGKSFEGGVAPGWKSDDYWAFTVDMVETDPGVLHELVCTITSSQSDDMPQDCIWAVTDTTDGLNYTFIGGALFVHRKVGP